MRKLAYDICWVFQRPFACMNDPEIKQICRYFNWVYGLNIYLLRYKIIRLIKSFVQSVAPSTELISSRVDWVAIEVIHACKWPLKNLIHICPRNI